MSWSLPPHPRDPFQPGTRRPELDDSISAQGEDGDGQQLRHGRRTARPKKQLAADVFPVEENMGKLGKKNWVESSETAEIQETSLGGLPSIADV